MPKRENLIGQKFNHLTVIGFDEQKTAQSHRSHWICECDCEDHTILSVMASNLKRGNTTKCKYCKAENLIGQKFNLLTVTKRVIDEQDHVKWECQCECGNSIIIRGDSLKTGHTKSCGCLQKQHAAQLKASNLIGQRFGKLVVVKRSQRKNANGQYYWYCNCDCGTLNKEINGHNLVSKGTYSCGCVNSKGEEKIAQILSENNISYIREYSPSDFLFPSGHPTYFDFAVLTENGDISHFIEYQGEQHFQSRGLIFTPEKVSEIQQRDKLKKQYCIDKNIPIIYINYTDYNNFTIKDLILNEEK